MNPAFMKDGAAWLSPQIGTAPAASAAGSVNGAAVDRVLPGVAPGLALSCDLVAQTGAATGGPTTQTLDAKIQDSPDGSTGWADYIPPGAASVAAIPQITAINTLARKRVDLSGARRYIRVVTTVGFTGGSSPTLGNAVVVELCGLENPPTA